MVLTPDSHFVMTTQTYVHHWILTSHSFRCYMSYMHCNCMPLWDHFGLGKCMRPQTGAKSAKFSCLIASQWQQFIKFMELFKCGDTCRSRLDLLAPSMCSCRGIGRAPIFKEQAPQSQPADQQASGQAYKSDSFIKTTQSEKAIHRDWYRPGVSEWLLNGASSMSLTFIYFH